MILPSHYFGSFEVVSVHLSETVMSFKVTEKSNIMDVLGLVLKPNDMVVSFYLMPKDALTCFFPAQELAILGDVAEVVQDIMRISPANTSSKLRVPYYLVTFC